MHQGPEKIVVSRNSTLKHNQKNTGCSVVTYQPHFLWSLSFIKFQTVEFKHLLSSNFAQVFRVLAGVI